MQVDVIDRYLRGVATRAAAISRAIVCEVKVLCGCLLAAWFLVHVTWRWSGGREAGRGAGRQPRLFSPRLPTPRPDAGSNGLESLQRP